MTKLERFIARSIPGSWLIRKSKHLILPGFQGIPLYPVVKFFAGQVKKLGLLERASAISFNVIMAIPAACIFLFSLVPYLPVASQFKAELLALTKDLSPNDKTYKLVESFLTDFLKKSRGGVLSFGILLVIFYASNAMIGVIRTFDQSISHAKTYIFHKRWRAIRLTVILILLVITSVLLLIGHDALEKILKNYFHLNRYAKLDWWEHTRWILIVLLIFFGISFIYKFAPSVEKRWDLISPGSILATILTLATTIGFSYWVTHFGNYNKVYGSIGTVMIIMLLINFNSLILLIGFELNVSITFLQKESDALKNKSKTDATS